MFPRYRRRFRDQDPDPFYAEIGARVRLARESHGLSQLELGQRMDYPQPKSTVVRIETGYHALTPRELVKLQELLGWSVQRLVTGAA